MTDVALGYARASSTWRAHGSHELDVNKLAEGVFLAIIPPPMVHPLSQDFDRWLRAIGLLGGHVEVVDEDNTRHPQRRAKDPLAAFIKLRVDDVLCLSEQTAKEGEVDQIRATSNSRDGIEKYGERNLFEHLLREPFVHERKANAASQLSCRSSNMFTNTLARPMIASFT